MKDLTLRDLEWMIRARWHELQRAIKKARDRGERVISEVGRALPPGLERRLRAEGYRVDAGTRRKKLFAAKDEPMVEYYIIRW